MFCTASVYLEKVKHFARLCGTFPYRSDTIVSLNYMVYSLFLLLISAFGCLGSMVYHFLYYRDILCFTLVLTDVVTFVSHLAVILNSLLSKKIYKKIFKRFACIERMLHTLNIVQNQNPTDNQMYIQMIFASLTAIILGSVLYFLKEFNIITIIGSVATYVTFLACSIHVICLLLFVEHKYHLINWHLEYLNNKFPLYFSQHEAKLFMRSKLNTHKVTVMFVDPSSQIRQITAQNIRKFNQVHFLLYSAFNLISEYFSPIVLFSVLATALAVISTSIFTFDYRYSCMSFDTVFLVINVHSFVQIFLIANTVHKISSEVSNQKPYYSVQIKVILFVCN